MLFTPYFFFSAPCSTDYINSKTAQKLDGDFPLHRASVKYLVLNKNEALGANQTWNEPLSETWEKSIQNKSLSENVMIVLIKTDLFKNLTWRALNARLDFIEATNKSMQNKCFPCWIIYLFINMYFDGYYRTNYAFFRLFIKWEQRRQKATPAYSEMCGLDEHDHLSVFFILFF